MWRTIKLFSMALLLTGCSVPSLSLFSGSGTITSLSLPSVDSGYSNLKTRVITSQKEYRAFLSSIDRQKYWEHKIAFGMKIAKESINFRTQNLLIYRYHGTEGKAVQAKVVSAGDQNVTVQLTVSEKTLPRSAAQAFFYKVSKKLPKVIFKSRQRIDVVKNSRQKTVIPKECIAWFDGCNHCIRSSMGRALCTKRYCKKKDAFRCVKWQ